MLHMLKAKNINYTSKIRFGKKMGFGELEKFNGVQLNKSYAIFELTFGAELTVKSVEQISGFDHDIDKELVKILENSTWVSSNVKGSEGSKILVGFYFYEAEPGYTSLVGEYDV